MIRIAVDVMGGDNAPGAIIDGLCLFLNHHKDVSFTLFGCQDTIKCFLRRAKELDAVSEIVHTENNVSAHDKPSLALRKMRSSSMALALEAVAEQRCCATVSAGNTGAYLALSKNILKTQGGIDRPAIASLFPTIKGCSAMLDLGGSLEASSRNLCEYALMGNVFAQKILGISEPSVALLNVGKEETKGNDHLKQAFQNLQNSSMNFIGFIEGNDIAQGKASVIVTDGFTGNVALKSAEGIVTMTSQLIKKSIEKNILTKASGFFVRSIIKEVYKKIDPKAHNGAIWLGLNGIAIKSHGNADARSFSYAVKKAYDMKKMDIITAVNDAMTQNEDMTS